MVLPCNREGKGWGRFGCCHTQPGQLQTILPPRVASERADDGINNGAYSCNTRTTAATRDGTAGHYNLQKAAKLNDVSKR